MGFELTPAFWSGLGQIILVNIVLSGDNALVIALACCVILWRDEHPWLAPLARATFSAYDLLCAGLCLTGMACCCRAVLASEARSARCARRDMRAATGCHASASAMACSSPST